MKENAEERGSIAVVSPTLSIARSAAVRLRRRRRDRGFVPFSLDRLLDCSPAPRQIVLCPSGNSLREDVAFLEESRARLVWPAPPAALRAAIAGLLGGEHAGPRSRASARQRVAPGLLLEGRVTRQRARRALESDARIWIVERAQLVRLPRLELDRLSALGVRWVALDPVRVIALFASPALARERARWRHLLPPRTPVWIRRRW